jgi:hypothetical protein
MRTASGAVVWLALGGVLASCGDECRSYSSFSCKQIEAADYNIYFYFPSGTEQYLGEAKGLSQLWPASAWLRGEQELVARELGLCLLHDCERQLLLREAPLTPLCRQPSA